MYIQLSNNCGCGILTGKQTNNVGTHCVHTALYYCVCGILTGKQTNNVGTYCVHTALYYCWLLVIKMRKMILNVFPVVPYTCLDKLPVAIPRVWVSLLAHVRPSTCASRSKLLRKSSLRNSKFPRKGT